MNTERPDHDGTASPTPEETPTPEKTTAKAETEADETRAGAGEPEAQAETPEVEAEMEEVDAEEPEVDGKAVSLTKAEDDDPGRIRKLGPVEETPGEEARAATPDDDVVVEDTGGIRRLGPVEEVSGGDAEGVDGDVHVIGAPRKRRPSALIVSIAAAAVLLVGAGGALIASNASAGPDGEKAAGVPAQSDSDGDGAPPPNLALDGYSAPSTGGGNGIAPGEPNPYGTTYRATGALPDGPTSAPVYWATGEVDQSEVTRLAKALGVEGTPVVEGPAWRVGGGQDGTGPVLRVNRTAPGMWTYIRYSAGTDNCPGITTCAKQPMDTTVDPVSEAVAEDAAEPVLKAVGLDDAKVDASQTAGAQRVVNADPVLDKLPTNGWTTGITVSGQGEVVSGTGQLAAPEKGASYPVLSAARTLELLNSAQGTTHRMGIGGCAEPVPLKDRLEQPCRKLTTAEGPEQSVAKVSGAAFGLAAHTSQGKQLLVPSWLFTVDAATPYVVSYPAVDPKYLAGEATPAPSSPGKSMPRNVKVDGYTASGDELTVRFTGGVCGDYSVSAKETDAQVTVTVTETPWQDKVCIMIAKEYDRTVKLEKALGDRKVVGSDGAAIPIVKPGARLPETVR
ncbi:MULTISPECIES: hypothetical protein [unclassified Streptomyces]|uniref:hypothetical protein n=1 Tax=unclassified Streptomyces TaxID=2593676 RepID=UPI000DD710FF|nr:MULTISPECIES: hypothetical protein [unclassified Streptomyces]QZZ27377.1 hypothetical protein A7X85_14810 [Streptomyces sp. ST1015]